MRIIRGTNTARPGDPARTGNPARAGSPARRAALGAAVLIAGSAAGALLATAAPAGADAPPHGTPAATGAHATAPLPVLAGCAGQGQVAPRRIVLACAGGNDYLRHLNWSVWNSTALGTGTEWIRNCVPDCARGTLRHYRVLVNLWRAERVPGTQDQHYTRLTTIFTHTRPVIGSKPATVRTWRLRMPRMSGHS